MRGRGRGHQEGRGGWGGRRNAANARTPNSTATDALQEAEALQQRADRRRSPAAYQQAADSFQRAIMAGQAQQGSIDSDRLADAFFGLGESLQCCAEETMSVCATLPDESLTHAAEVQAQQTALALLQRSVTAFQQARDGPSGQPPRIDALVASGNALASAAELVPPEQAIELLQAASEAYGAALQRDEDAGTLSNAADAWVAAAQKLCEAGRQSEGAALFSRAMQAYQRSCELSSSEEGDDLPGLLHNWGVGLYEMGSQAAKVDPAAGAAAFDESAARLKTSIGFNRADVAPMNAMGDVRLAQSELLAAALNPAAAALAALAALNEGYSAALQISGRDPDALIGTAEGHAQMGKLSAASGDVCVAREHWAHSADAYAAALSNPAVLGSFEERCNVRYNCACVCAQCGRFEDAHRLLQALLVVGGTAPGDLIADQDLDGVRTLPWFLSLLQA